jgi:RNA polymerase sigma factor (sigma-70 family)
VRRSDSPFDDLEQLIGRVYSYAAYRVGNVADAEDATSETFERALRYRSSYDPSKGPPIAWLIGIARGVIADTLSERGHHTNGNGNGSGHEGHDFTAELLERIDLRAAVRTLEPRDRDLIALRHGADLTTAQIAALLGARPNAVDVALHRARARLAGLLAESA